MISYTNVFTLAVILAVTLPIGVRGADPTFDLKTTAGKILGYKALVLFVSPHFYKISL